jgi:hypothetical protein
MSDTDTSHAAPPCDEPETTVVATHTTIVDRAELAWFV